MMLGNGFLTSKVCVKLFVLVVTAIFLSSTNLTASTVRLNEVMASNSETIADQDGNNEDWIELHNYGSLPVNLGGWFLSDNHETTRMWEFPDITIQAGGYLTVWASNKNRTQGELHTNFAISASGEVILLVNQQGVIVDSLPPMQIPTDISVGRVGNNNQAWYYFDTPTPGLVNSSQYYNGIVPPPRFSHTGGVHRGRFVLTISTDFPETSIYYTTDGSKPDPANTSGTNYRVSATVQRQYITHRYTQPIQIEDRTGRANPLHSIPTATATGWGGTVGTVTPSQPPLTGMVVRARAYRSGYLPSEIVTHSYIIRNANYPVPLISIAVPEPYFFSEAEGIYVPGEYTGRQPWLQSDTLNYNERGIEWEREINVEFIYPDGQVPINQRAGARIHGGFTRNNPQKSLRLYARGRYGNPEFNHRFFSTKPTNTFRRILLRASGQDNEWTFFRDALLQTLMLDRGLDIQHWQPAVTFINGEYWGILNIRDRIDRFMLHQEHGVDPDNLDILTGNFDRYEVVEGDDNHYIQMINYASSNDLSQHQHYSHIKTMVDVENFAEYYAFKIYINNTDWPGNNVTFWRLRTQYNPNAPHGHDGRWRWIVFDTDFGFGGISYLDGMMGGRTGAAGPSHNTLSYATDPAGSTTWNAEWSTRLIRNLLANREFRNKFINRFADLMNKNFHPDTVNSRIDYMQGIYNNIIDDQIARWRRIPSRQQWYQEIDVMRNFARQRPNYMRQHIQNYFNLTGTSSITVRVGQGNGTIRVSTLNLENLGSWTGTYFNGVPIEIEAIPDVNYSFSHWEGAVNSQEELIEVVLSGGAITLTAHFVEDTINPMVHYWHFNNLGTGELSSVAADFSATGSGRITYAGSSQGYLDRIDGDLNNYRLSAVAGYGLRARNPSSGRSLVIEAPTTGFEHIVFSYATRRTANGSQRQRVSYSIDGGSSWVVLGESIEVNEEYGVRVFDLRNIPGVNNNSRLRFRIEFTGQNASLTEGNNRFDNIAVESLDPSIPVIDIITSVQERLSSSWRVSLGPNPINDDLIVVIDNPNEEYIGESVEVVVRDLRGRVKKTATIDIEGVGENISSMIDVSLLDSGIYIVDLYKNGNRIRRMDFTKIKRD